MAVYKLGLRFAPQLCASQISKICAHQRATIIGIDRKDPAIDAEKPPPYPYKTKNYWWPQYSFGLGGGTKNRMDENSKIIIVEGNKSCGKESVAQQLAAKFGMKYYPETNLDEFYINHRGFDYRTLNKYIAEICHAVDEKMFYENPFHKALPHFNYNIFFKRMDQYIDALAHLFNTGQGVVLERSIWSDFVFVEAMHKHGYLHPQGREWLRRVRFDSIYLVQRPHLVVYLDVPADKLLERIRKRNRPHEVNSKVFANADYLKEIEHQYKNVFLPDINTHSEVLMYDWSEDGDIDGVVEDIERIDFEHYDHNLDKMSDWSEVWEEDEWNFLRLGYTGQRSLILQKGPMKAMVDDLDHVAFPDHDSEHMERIYQMMAPGYNYMPSYDPGVHGWWKVITRLGPENRYEEHLANDRCQYH